MAASSGSENLEISIYTTLYSFAKVSLGFFSFSPQKSQLHFDNLSFNFNHYTPFVVPKTDTLMIVLLFRFNGNMFSAEGDAVFIDCFYTF